MTTVFLMYLCSFPRTTTPRILGNVPGHWAGGACSLPLVPIFWHESGGHNGWKRVEYEMYR